MRIPSSEVFQVNGNGTFFIKRPIMIGGNFFDKILFSQGISVGDLELTTFIGKDLEVEDNNGTYILTGYYE